MIQDVEIKRLQPHADDRGFLMELLRVDDPIFEQFGQAYVSLNYPGVIRAWHYHKEQTDLWVCVKGMIKVGLYDPRDESPTRGEANTIYLGEHNYALLKIPVGVYHGYKTVGAEPSLLINFPTKPYNREQPDEYRAPYDSPDIPFDWEVKFT
ncbi:MAG: dTDP-4-dehydrorhamnose 3,5-epimerase family protein [Armatimonadetes bacterium]|nr:dTDP-4-dehydrorhamnose 3,5-epimerase family protein [Armatimonadota bacterium]